VTGEPASRPGLGTALGLGAVLLLAASLRLPRLGTLQGGLIPDEAAVAYDAWSILATGRDQYGETLPLFPRSTARLNCLYVYLCVPGVAGLGLTEAAARLPAALAGVATVGLVFFLVRRAGGTSAGLLAAGFLAVSPWHVLLSRTAFDWVTLPALSTLTAVLAARALEGRAGGWLAGLAGGVSLYGYAPVRPWLPLVLIGLALTHRRAVARRWRSLVGGAALLVVLAVPVAWMTLKPEGRERLEAVTGGATTALDAVRGFAGRYVASFDPSFYLRPAGEPELHRLRSSGLLTALEAALLLLGVLGVVRERREMGRLLLYWLLAAPLAVSLHRDCPDPILLVTMLPAPQALAGLGGAALLRGLARLPRLRWVGVAALSAAAALTARATALDLYRDYPTYSASLWTHGVREMVAEIESRRAGYDGVVVDGRHKLIGGLILFYAAHDPAARQAEVAGLTGREPRTVVGPYRIGDVDELLRRPGRYLVWTTRAEGRRLFPGREPLAVVRWPDGRHNHALFARETSPAATASAPSAPGSPARP
jgi:4-amino-4-deoxy-L-arabinose transferase-like glycosyltransferase